MNEFFKCDKPKEECGVFGIYSKEIKKDILKTLNYALYALQHRGQESAGITVSNYKHLFTYKSMGLVSDLFSSNFSKSSLSANSSSLMLAKSSCNCFFLDDLRTFF